MISLYKCIYITIITQYIFRHLWSLISGYILNYQIKLKDVNIEPTFHDGMTKKMDPPIPLILTKRK